MDTNLLSNACLNLTDDCNLRCVYCFVEQHPHYMTLQTAKDAVDFLVGNLRKKKNLGQIASDGRSAITFFGGEPMLCFSSVIQPLVSYIEEKYPNETNLSMTTNGTLLNEERVKWLKDHNIPILLSIDGAPETQNINRPCKNSLCNSADQVLKNIPYILKEFPQTTFRSTIYQETVDHTFENYLFAQYLGFRNIFMMPNCRDPWTYEQADILYQEYEKIYDYIIECFRNGVQPIYCATINNSFEQVLKHDIAVVNDTLKKTATRRPTTRCGLGTSFGSISYDGSIYGCQEQDSKDHKSFFYIGDIYNGINKELHQRLLDEYGKEAFSTCEDPGYCENCPLQTQCHIFACPSTTWDLYQDFHQDSKIHCFWIRTMFDQAVRAMNILVAEDNQTFKDYLYIHCNFKNYWKEEE